MENQESQKIKNVVVVLELTEEPTSSVFPIPGADGSEIGLMTFCPVRGRHCLRMPLDVFRKHRYNLFTARRRFFHLVPDIEFIYENDEDKNEATELNLLIPEPNSENPPLQGAKKRGRPAKSNE